MKSKISVVILHRTDDTIEVPLEAYVIARIPGEFPSSHIRGTVLDHVMLADPSFNVPDKVSMVLGAGMRAAIVKPGIRSFESAPELIGQEAILGCVVWSAKNG